MACGSWGLPAGNLPPSLASMIPSSPVLVPHPCCHSNDRHNGFCGVRVYKYFLDQSLWCERGGLGRAVRGGSRPGHRPWETAMLGRQGLSQKVCLKPRSVPLGRGGLAPSRSSFCFRECIWGCSISSVNPRDVLIRTGCVVAGGSVWVQDPFW